MNRFVFFIFLSFLFLFSMVQAHTANLRIETEYPNVGMILGILHPEENYLIDQNYVETDFEGVAFFNYEDDFYSSAGFRVSILDGNDVFEERDFLGPYIFNQGEIVLSFLEPIVPIIPEIPVDSDSDRKVRNDFYTDSDDGAFISNPSDFSDEFSDSNLFGESSIDADSDFITAFVSKEIMGKPVFVAFVIIIFIFLAWWLWTRKTR